MPDTAPSMYLFLDPEDFCRTQSQRAYREESGWSVTWDRIVSTVAWAPKVGLHLWVRGEDGDQGKGWSATFAHQSIALHARPDGWWRGAQWTADKAGFYVLRIMQTGIAGRCENAGQLRSVVLTDDPDWTPSDEVGSQSDLMMSVYGPVTGSTTMDPPVAVAGQPLVLQASYLVGAEGIASGGTIQMAITAPPWDAPQTEEPEQPGFVQAVGPQGQRMAVRVERPSKPSASREHLIRVSVGEFLREGDKVTVIYGRRPDGTASTSAPILPATYHNTTKDTWYQDLVPLSVSVDTDGSGICVPVPPARHHVLTLTSGPPARIMLIAPSRVRCGQPFSMIAVITDHYNNVATLEEDHLLQIEGPAFVTPSEWVMKAGRPMVKVLGPWVVSAPGTHHIRAALATGQLEAQSNPIEAVAGAEDLILWGDLHVHTHLSDGRGTAQRCFEYARDVAGLDFVSVSDHDVYMSEGQWEYLQTLTAYYHAPHQFITFVGCESGPQWVRDYGNHIQGHRNLYTREDQLPLYRHWDVQDQWGLDRLEEMMAMNPGIMAIPHHSLTLPLEWRSWTGTPAIEIYSVWGSSERRDNPLLPVRQLEDAMSVQEVLARGDRLGFLGGGDSHDGRPGVGGDHAKIKSAWGELKYKTGLTAVVAKSRTRADIWEAIFQRRTYATTGERIILDWDINGTPMGSVITVPHADVVRTIQARMVGTRAVTRVVIWRNGEVFWERNFASDTVDLSINDAEPLDRAHSYYYLWLEQEGGGQAWASPIWVEVENGGEEDNQ